MADQINCNHARKLSLEDKARKIMERYVKKYPWATASNIKENVREVAIATIGLRHIQKPLAGMLRLPSRVTVHSLSQ
jgi:hypothetical protein